MDTSTVASRASPSSSWLSDFDVLVDHRRRSMTSDLGVVRQRISDLTNGCGKIDIRRADKLAGFLQVQAHVGQTKLQFLEWNGEAECETSIVRSPDHRIVLHIPVEGEFEVIQGDESINVRPGQMVVVAASGSSRRRWCGISKLLNVIVERSTFERLIKAQCDGEPPSRLDFGPLASLELSKMRTLTQFIELMVRDLTSPTSMFGHPALATQAERTFLMLLLNSIPNSYSTCLTDTVRIEPYYVRRADRYVHAHMQEEITLKELASAAGVSVRTLFNGFRVYRDSTPMKFIKHSRMKLARKMLIDARTTGIKVTAVAGSVGYANLSQFSRDYKKHFLESPLQTVRGR